MSITQELRGYATNWHGFFYDNKDGCLIQAVGHQPPDSTPVTEIFREIADRIDERYRIDVLAANLAGKSNAMQEAVERAESTHVKLPVDADGVPIHVGDEMDVGIVFAIGDEGVFMVENGFSGKYDVECFDGFACHHVQPDTWERIIEDACDMAFICDDDAAGKAELVERCKRLAGESE